jgi:HAD superfamily hydrolase (TIGR01549 family)
MRVQAVVFDLGETLVDESRSWAAWADWLGLRPFDLFAALGATIERRQDHRRAFELLRPGFDLERERAAKEAAGRPWGFDASDLYPDALPCLEELRAAGMRIGIVGNQPAVVESMLPVLHGTVDVVGSSGRWGVEKPSPAFFERVVAELGLEPGAIAYVGDRLDNDVLPAMALGMVGVFLVRGPWALVQRSWPEAARATLAVDALDGLADRLVAL